MTFRLGLYKQKQLAQFFVLVKHIMINVSNIFQNGAFTQTYLLTTNTPPPLFYFQLLRKTSL